MGWLPFGITGLTSLCARARPSMSDPDALERLYDEFRVGTAGLIRADRPDREFDSWMQGMRSVAAFAKGSSRTEQKDDPHVRFADRIETLVHLLADHVRWRSAYVLPQALDLPFVRRALEYLDENGSVRIGDYQRAMEIPRLENATAALTILANIRLITWDEERAPGDIEKIRVRLTPLGKTVVAGLNEPAVA